MYTSFCKLLVGFVTPIPKIQVQVTPFSGFGLFIGIASACVNILYMPAAV